MTATLPSAYAPFLPVLERLSDPLQQILRGHLLQFERLVRLTDEPRDAVIGEFEGFDGLTNRGDVPQIVQSELLLRTRAPLEFLRRLAESETLFLDKRHADPGARHSYRVIVSAGPGVLGHGRLVALAAVIYLARIAQARNAAFHWCVLPATDEATWFAEVSVRSVKRFLRAASYHEMAPDDLEGARQKWAADADSTLADWVIAAAPPAHAPRRAPAPSDNVLSFALAPPRPGEPRAADLFIRQDGRERSRATITFPDDRVCVSALTNPFQPVKPAWLEPPATAKEPTQAGWAPEYLTTLQAHLKFLRIAGGLLILTSTPKEAFDRRWFLPLPDGTQLVGAWMRYQVLYVVVHWTPAGQEALTMFRLHLVPGSAPSVLQQQSKHVPSRHLFREHGPYVIPPLQTDSGVTFYSGSGQSYQLSTDPETRETVFTPLYKAPKILHVAGPYHVTRGDNPAGDVPLLRVTKPSGSHEMHFAVPPGFPDRPRGLLFLPGDRQLAYSLRPGAWILPRQQRPPPRAGEPPDNAAAQPAPEIVLAPHERLLSVKLREDGVTARVWSDARHGGEGKIQSLRFDGDERTQGRQPVLKLDDAHAIVRLEACDDGLWAVTVDARGHPDALLHYLMGQNRPEKRLRRYAVADLLAGAERIDLAKLHE